MEIPPHRVSPFNEHVCVKPQVTFDTRERKAIQVCMHFTPARVTLFEQLSLQNHRTTRRNLQRSRIAVDSTVESRTRVVIAVRRGRYLYATNDFVANVH